MRRLLRWWVGLLWLAGWALLLWAVHGPWRELGGLVSERLRWLERFVLAAGLVVGHTLGDLARATPAGRRVRWLLYPAAMATAGCMLLLRVMGHADGIGVVLTAFVSYAAGASTAGLDLGPYCRDERSGDVGEEGRQAEGSRRSEGES